MVIIHSTGSLKGLSVETILKWEFPFFISISTNIFSSLKRCYFIKAPKVTGQTAFRQPSDCSKLCPFLPV